MNLVGAFGESRHSKGHVNGPVTEVALSPNAAPVRYGTSPQWSSAAAAAAATAPAA